MRVGLVANEFFDASLGGSLGRMGGFGWAARQVVRYFQRAPEHGVEVVCFSRRPAVWRVRSRPTGPAVPRARRGSRRAPRAPERLTCCSPSTIARATAGCFGSCPARR
jgi:hypothetical protein